MSMKRRGRRGSGGDQGAHWISYSDMMASLLLVFVLAVVYSVYQYYQMLEIKTQELRDQQEKLEETSLALVEREEEANDLNAKLVGEQAKVALIQIQLQKQEADLHAANEALKTQKDKQDALQLQLTNQEADLKAMSLLVSEQKDLLSAQQKQLDELVGVRTEIIKELSIALTRANLKVTVDKTTGDIVLDSAVLFDSSSNVIKPEGKDMLNRFLPVYLSVLMRPEYQDDVSEILIVGHTDTAGSYTSNLKLSQNRALAVAEYCLQMPGLSDAQQMQLKDLMTVQGRSESDPVLYPDGNVNMDASRRVEFKFRLKDAEMIEEINKILSQSQID